MSSKSERNYYVGFITEGGNEILSVSGGAFSRNKEPLGAFARTLITVLKFSTPNKRREIIGNDLKGISSALGAGEIYITIIGRDLEPRAFEYELPGKKLGVTFIKSQDLPKGIYQVMIGDAKFRKALKMVGNTTNIFQRIYNILNTVAEAKREKEKQLGRISIKGIGSVPIDYDSVYNNLYEEKEKEMHREILKECVEILYKLVEKD